MSDNYGDQHPMTNRFRARPGGIGIPDGEGNFLKGALNLIAFGEFGQEVVVAPSVDGRAHSTGRIDAEDISAEMYANDAFGTKLVNLALLATKQGLAGHKLPWTLDVLNLDDTVATSYLIEEMFVRGWRHSALSKDPGEPAKIMITFSVFNVSPLT